MQDMVKFKGQVVSQFFPKGRKKIYDGDFGILRVEVIEEIQGTVEVDEKDKATYEFDGRKVITVKGECLEYNYLDVYTFLAEQVGSDFGLQYNIALMFHPQELETKEHVKTFLSQILTNTQTEEIMKTFDDPLAVLEKGDINSLKQIKGVGDATAVHMIKKYENNKDFSVAFVELGKYGLSVPMIKKIIKSYKSPDIAVKKIKENIYILADEINGIGFKKADQIAKKNGVSKESDYRIQGWLMWYLNNSANAGDSYVPRNVLFKDMFTDLGDAKLDVLKSRISPVFNGLRDKGVLWWDDGKKNIGLKTYLSLETSIKAELMRLSYPNKTQVNGLESRIEKMQEEQGWDFTDEQISGIYEILNNNLTFVTGLGGSGKSTVVTSAVKLFGFSKIAQVALAGRAAQRMFELNGIESYTIHKLLGLGENDEDEEDDSTIDLDLLIIDEASMIGGDLFIKLLRAIDSKTRVVIVGDNGQLTPIGKCNVFSDVLNSGVLPCVKLTKIHRQAEASGIISSSIDIRQGKQLFPKDYSGKQTIGELEDFDIRIFANKEVVPSKVCTAFKEGIQKYKTIEDVQVVVPLRENGQLSTFKLNKVLQQIYNSNNKKKITISKSKDKSYDISVGDKVINMKNNYKTVSTSGILTPTFNGNIGMVNSVSEEKLVIDFWGIGEIIIERAYFKNIELAYAVTTHKLQGSSAKYVICAFDFSAYMLLNREMIYTAITRAEKQCTLIGESNAIRYAVSHSENKRKNTHLTRLLNE